MSNLSFTEFQEAHAAKLRDLAEERDSNLDALEQRRAAIFDQHAAAVADAEGGRASEFSKRSLDAARFAHSKLAPLSKAFAEAGSRDAALALAAAVRLVAGETERLMGRPYAGRGAAREVLGDRLWIVAVAVHLAKDPEALAIFANSHCGTQVVPGTVEAIDRATRVCLDRNAAPGELIEALQALETSVSRTAREGNRTPLPDAKERFEAHRRHAHPAEISAALAALDATAEQARREQHENDATLIQRARFSDGSDDNAIDAEKGVGPGWAKALRAVKGRLRIGDGGVIRPE